MNEKIQIGIIAKPQGIKGELKIKSLTDDNERFHSLEYVYIDNMPRKVLSARVNSNEVFLFISGIADRTAAEVFRGKALFVDRKDAAELDDDRYFIVDVIGSTVKGERVYGKVKDILQHGSADVYILDSGIMFPFLKDVVETVDIEKKLIVVNEERFHEVAVFNDKDGETAE